MCHEITKQESKGKHTLQPKKTKIRPPQTSASAVVAVPPPMVSGGCLNGGLAGSSRTSAAHNRGGSTNHTQHVCHYQSPSCHLPAPSAARDRDTIVVLPLLFSENEKGELSSSGSTVWLCRLVMRRPFKEGFSCVCVGGAVALVWVGGIQSCRCTVRYKRNWHNWIYYC